jgi:cobalt-zinc-cadmium efflux system protein
VAHVHHAHDHHAAHAPAPHAHTHVHTPASYDRVFAIGIGLNLLIVLIQVGFGFLAGSLALLADAGHNLSDVMALLLAWGAAVLSRRHASLRRTYGWRRISILAALVNALTIVAVTAAVVWEAIHRLAEPAPLDAGIVIWVAIGGVVINGITAMMFLRGREHDLNIRGAFLHMAADAAVSLGVALSGVIILFTGWLRLDAIASIGVGIAILYSAWGLIRDAGNLILDAVPHGIDMQEVREVLLDLPGVAEVHDLHVWAMSTTEIALTAHLVTQDGPPQDALLAHACAELREEFGIDHATLQIECGDPNYPCELVDVHRVS